MIDHASEMAAFSGVDSRAFPRRAILG